MHYIVLDLEATCWQDKSARQANEIIEIGAVKINEKQERVDEFSAFVRPALHPVLSPFCTELTSIRQKDVDQAADFKTVITDFWNWIDLDSDYFLCSWGFYDKSQFKKDCELHNLPTEWLKPHISLKHQYGKIKRLNRLIGMGGALYHENLELEGTHHRGIDDARNISKIFLKLFDAWKFE